MANPTPGRPRFYAGVACLDFANTVEPRVTQPEFDFLPDFAALIHWSDEAKLLTPVQRRRLSRQAEENPAAAHRAYDAAITFRESLYRLFAAVAAAKSPRGLDLQALQHVYVDAQQHATATLVDGRLEWTWREPSLAYPAWRIAGDAIELLRSDRLQRVKRCQPTCGWLFLDTTKNNSRRWCSMRECGFEAKVQRQRESTRVK
ncbi:CGNR zinc finger domain-containing protein [Kribbella sp. CA-294648]|uniref:CGNR zinc finger domain-containing protein n=1 Tax=Kribbella sp. CA-294648 TaxID=3239948 RepID=UPI003D8BB2E3